MAAKTAEKKEKKAARGGAFTPDPGVCRIISLGDGTHAYIFNTAGKTLHVQVPSPAWKEALRQLVEAFGDVVVAGWVRSQFAEPASLLAALETQGASE